MGNPRKPAAKKVKAWEEIPKPSHLCVARSCAFGRTTFLPGKIVSSVGEYRNARTAPGVFETIGCNRLYETMVFNWNGKRCTDKDCPCGGGPAEGSVDFGEIDFAGANTRDECNANHDRLVKDHTPTARKG